MHLNQYGTLRSASRFFRRISYIAHYLALFLIAIVAKRSGVWSSTGRRIIWGKLRRTAICTVPGLGERLQRRHGLEGRCNSCGASCNLIMQCPHWDDRSKLCKIYEDRPLTCRLFPITPADLEDLKLGTPDKKCGYFFKENPEGLRNQTRPLHRSDSR
jgi:hypothetical protein